MRFGKWAISALLILSISMPQAVSAQKRSVKILGVSVEGNRTTDANMVRLSSGITPGMEITGDGIQEAIRQLWRLDLFSDIRIVVERELAEGVFIVIRVKEYPRLDKFEYQGNKKLKKEDIETATSFYPGQVVNPGMIARAKSKLLDKYKEKGHLLAKIKTAQEYTKEDSSRVNVRFIFDEGRKVQIERIDFHGNEKFTDKKLRKQLKKTKENTWLRGGDFDRKKYEEDQGLLLDFYANHGYRDIEILRDSISYNQLNDEMYIDIWINEGPQYTFGDITFEGNKIFTTEELNSQLGFAKGEIYSKKKLEEAIMKNIGTLYYDRGYIYAQTVPRETEDENQELDIHFIVSEGKQARINEIKIVGNSKTREKVIRRELRILPGDFFNRSLLERSQREVWMLNYFANVEPKVTPIDEDKVDLEFKVEEKSTDTANMSAGWSEYDRFVGSVGLSMANLMGTGQRASIDWNFGRYYRSLNLGYAQPWVMDTPTTAGFNVYNTMRSAVWYGFRQESQGFTLSLGRRLSWPDNFFSTSLMYSLDQTSLSDFNETYKQYNPNGIVTASWPRTSSAITQVFSRNSLDRPEFPTAGSDVTFTNELSGTFLGGTVDYHKHTMRFDWFMPSVWNLVLYSSFQGGYMEGIGKNPFIPYYEYFFMGGSGMSRSIPLRGYNDPLSEDYSAAEGGKAMLKYTMELRVPIAPNPTIFALLFAEAGNVWPDFKHADPSSMKRSAGVGARVYMPMIGIIGFDYGYGFDRVDAYGNAAPKWKMHFVFGKSF